MVPGLGTRKAGILVQTFRTPQAIFRASKSELQAAGLSAAVAQSIASGGMFRSVSSPSDIEGVPMKLDEPCATPTVNVPSSSLERLP